MYDLYLHFIIDDLFFDSDVTYNSYHKSKCKKKKKKSKKHQLLILDGSQCTTKPTKKENADRKQIKRLTRYLIWLETLALAKHISDIRHANMLKHKLRKEIDDPTWENNFQQ